MGVGTYEGRVVPELVRSLAFMRTWKSQCGYRVVKQECGGDERGEEGT